MSYDSLWFMKEHRDRLKPNNPDEVTQGLIPNITVEETGPEEYTADWSPHHSFLTPEEYMRRMRGVFERLRSAYGPEPNPDAPSPLDWPNDNEIKL